VCVGGGSGGGGGEQEAVNAVLSGPPISLISKEGQLRTPVSRSHSKTHTNTAHFLESMYKRKRSRFVNSTELCQQRDGWCVVVVGVVWMLKSRICVPGSRRPDTTVGESQATVRSRMPEEPTDATNQ
jgi:hypothetical protein